MKSSVGSWHPLGGSLVPLMLAFLSAPVAAQVVELQSMKTEIVHQVRLKQWSRAKIDVHWKSADAVAIATDLSNRLLLPIVPSAGVREGVAEGSIPAVELEMKGVSVLAAMEVVSAKTGLRFVDYGRTLRLALPSEVKPEVAVRFYGVAELTFVLRDFVPPIGFGLRGSNQEPEPMPEVETRTASGFDEQGLADLIRKLTPAESWERDDVSIEVGRGFLIVRQTPRMHRAVAGVLRDIGRRV